MWYDLTNVLDPQSSDQIQVTPSAVAVSRHGEALLVGTAAHHVTVASQVTLASLTVSNLFNVESLSTWVQNECLSLNVLPEWMMKR